MANILFDTAQLLGWQALLRNKLSRLADDIESMREAMKEANTSNLEANAVSASEVLRDVRICIDQYTRAENALLLRQAPPPEHPPEIPRNELDEVLMDIGRSASQKDVALRTPSSMTIAFPADGKRIFSDDVPF